MTFDPKRIIAQKDREAAAAKKEATDDLLQSATTAYAADPETGRSRTLRWIAIQLEKIYEAAGDGTGWSELKAYVASHEAKDFTDPLTGFTRFFGEKKLGAALKHLIRAEGRLEELSAADRATLKAMREQIHALDDFLRKDCDSSVGLYESSVFAHTSETTLDQPNRNDDNASFTWTAVSALADFAISFEKSAEEAISPAKKLADKVKPSTPAFMLTQRNNP